MLSIVVHHLFSSVTFLLTLVFVSNLLRAKRASGSTIAWLLAICVLPYVGIPLYLLLSERKLGTRLAKKKKLYQASSDGHLTGVMPEVRRILSASGAPSAKENSKIDLLPTGVKAYDEIIGLIEGAVTSIHLTTFIFGNDVVGQAIVAALARKAAAGVDVRILVDSLGATLIRHPSFKTLVESGGRIAYFMPILHIPFKGRTNLRNHRKLMIVDGRIAVLGGMNLAQEYLGPSKDPQRWVDLALTLEGPCVRDLIDIFRSDWDFATHGRERLGSVPGTPIQSTKYLAQVVASGPDVTGDPLYDVLLSAIYGAKMSIWIVTPYFIPDESLNKALELATKRGVMVNVILPRKSNHRLADLARGSFVRGLRSTGVNFGFFPRMLHAKVVLVDQSLAILGSANFDMRSLLLNYELGLIVYSEDVMQTTARWIQEIHAETSSDLEDAGFWRDLAEGIGRTIGPMI